MKSPVPVQVLIADDSATARALLSQVLQDDGRFEIAGEAVDGLQAVGQTLRLKPDVILMDLHMPGIDGVEATRRVMDELPTPIIIITAGDNHADIKVTLNALDAGALAVLHKPLGPGSPNFKAECQRITATVMTMAGVTAMRRHMHDPEGWDQLEAALGRRRVPIRVIAIAASTGGPRAMRRVLSELVAPFQCPVLVVQHIADGFGQGLVEWLGEGIGLGVKLAADGEVLENGMVYVAPDHLHLEVSRDLRIQLSDAGPVEGAKPSATLLFESVSKVYGAGALAIILTGMGRDGVAGLRAVKAGGGLVLAQDEHSCVVFGMPGSAIAEGLVHAVVPLESMAAQIGRAVRHV